MSVLAVTANAQQYAPENDFSAKIIDNGRGVEIIKYTGSHSLLIESACKSPTLLAI